MNGSYFAHSSSRHFSCLRFAAWALLLSPLATGLPQALAAAAPTTTSLSVTSASSTVTSVAAGTVITLTAKVTTTTLPSTTVAPGLVKFCDTSAPHCVDTALLGTAQLTSAGIATFRFRPGIGTHTYLAIFAGTSSYAKSTSSTANLAVTGRYPTSTSIATSGLIGNYTLTATVVGVGSPTLGPTGDVSFLDTTNGNVSLGIVALDTAVRGQNFATGSTLGVGSFPASVVVGDFNGDGIPDLVTANRGDDTVTVLLGNGDGTFTLKSSPTAGSTPHSVTAGDFNGDGILDLAVANCNSCDEGNVGGTVTVLLGNGDGTFTLKSSPSVGSSPQSVAVGDFNRDGIPDLAVANFLDDTVTVLLGNGDGTFTLKSSPGVGSTPASVVVGDFNGDGIPDLATANFHDTTVTVLLGNGDGTFTVKSSPTVGNYPASVAVGDFNGDGIPDLATANSGSDDTVTLLLGKGDGTFAAKSTSHVGFTPDALAVGDFNGDGILDLAVVNYGGDTVTVLLGNGDGTFSTGSTLGVGGFPGPIAAGDLNGDGIPDLVVNGGGNTITSFLSQITETASAELAGVSVSGSETHQVVASYPGDTHHESSTSSPAPLLPGKIATALELTSNANPTPFNGYEITLTATLHPYYSGSLTTDGETVTYYKGGTSIGSGSLSSGVATLHIGSLPVGSNVLTAVYPGDNNFAAATSNSLTQTVSPNPGLLVIVNTDDAAGVPSNCTSAGATNCSLRDALAVAAANGGGNIRFSSTAFATPQTITLGGAGTLNIPSNTTISGPATSSSVGFANLVTVNGNGQPTVFFVDSGITNVVISGLNVTGGNVSGNGGNLFLGGGGILNAGTLTITNSNITGNSTFDNTGGGGISNQGGTLTLVNSTVAGNFAGLSSMVNQGDCIGGGGIFNGGILTITNSNITGNNTYDCTDNGSGILNGGTITNSIVADNINTVSGAPGPAEDDCDGSSCPTNGIDGNIVGSGLSQPFPGHPAICGGIIADIPPGLTTDQRGVSRTTTYSTSAGNVTCVDSGAIQSHYGLSFSTEPPASVVAGTSFGAAVQVTESGLPIIPGNNPLIPLALGAKDSGTLSGGSARTNGDGVAVYSNLSVSAAGSDDTLIATMTVTTTPPPAPLTQPLSVKGMSSTFDVLQQGNPVAQPMMSPPSGTYTSPQMVTITDATPGATVYYTTDGTVPSRSSKVFNPSSPILVSLSETIKALAVATGYLTSPEDVATYNIIPPYAATPTFSEASGFYTSMQVVSISDTTTGVKIYYTTGGATPTANSTLYTGPITISNSTQLRAIAVASGYSTSAVAIGYFYVATAKPVISLPTGTYMGTQMISITDTTPGAVIYYTTDGTVPSRSSKVFNPANPISVSSSETLKAIAVANGYTASPEAVAKYTITP